MGWAEVRVHGVSGTPPHDMLDLTQAAQADRIAGDEITGFYARRPDAPLAPGTELPPDLRLEAFSWGALTSGASGAWARALWILLVPFALANVAYWSRPRLVSPGADDPSRPGPSFVRDGAGSALTRAGALLLTAVFVVSTCVVGIDVLALGCLGGSASPCPPVSAFVGFTAAGYWAGPARLVLLGCAVPLLATGVLWFLGRTTQARYEGTEDPSRDDVADAAALVGADVATPHLLQQPDLWQGDARVARLRRIHLATALAVVVAYTGAMVVSAPGGLVAGWFGVLAGSLAVAVALAVVVAQRDDGPDGRDADGRRRALRGAGAPRVLLVGTVAAFVVQALLLLLGDLGGLGTARWSAWIPVVPVAACALVVAVLCVQAYPRRAVAVVCVVAVALMTIAAAVLGAVTGATAFALLAVVGPAVAVPLHRHDETGRSGWMWAGAAPGVFLGAGLFVGLIYSTALVMGTTAFLGGGVAAVTGVAGPSLPHTYTWFSASLAVFLVAALGALAVWWVRTRRMQPVAAATLAADLAGGGAQGGGTAGRLRARMLAARLRRGESVLGVLGVVASTTTLVALAGALAGTGPAPHGLARLAAAAGAVVSVAAAAGLVLLGRALGSGDGLRRGVGVLWDLSGFWPRCAHPFAPPCYAERAVPDLYTRARFHLSGRGRLLLSGHSLGSVLSVAVLVRLPADAQQRTALITYGSQLRQYFGRGFPGVFGAGVLGTLPGPRLVPTSYEYPAGTAAVAAPPPQTVAAVLAVGADAAPGRWRSLFRRTDPLGFPVFEDIEALGNDAGGRVDRVTTEVEAVGVGDTRQPRIQTHGGYTRTLEYAQSRSLLSSP